MSERVCAVVVTFNRKDLLRGTLAALAAQSRPLDCILVVDNASTDGTAALLASEYSHLRTIRLPENTGGSGGFHKGLEWAHAEGFDWIWVMDDDIVPFAGTLERMLGYQNISRFIHVRREDANGPFVWEGIWDIGYMQKLSFPTDLSFDNGKEWTAVNYGNFEGALIHRMVIDRIGLPDVRYFILGDDSVYGFLASFHTTVIYVNYIGIRRVLPFQDGSNPNRFYLMFRNKFLTFQHLRNANVPVSALLFWIHLAYMFGWLLLLSPNNHNLSHAMSMLRGVRDGARGRFGRPPWIAKPSASA